MDRWTSKPIACQGGLMLHLDSLTQGTQFPGSARTLQNYERSQEGGYRKINGFTKYDSNAVTGGTNNPVLGVKVFNGGVLACRKNSGGTDNIVYFSSGSGWTAVSSTTRGGSPTKARFIEYSITEPVAIMCDGVNPAWKYNGTTETTLNGSGAPSDPKFAALFRNRLALSGYGDGSKLTISAPNDDTDYTGGGGAAEINVGDTVTGLGTFRDDLIIFCRTSIKKLTGSTSSDFAIAEVVKSIGCISHDTIKELGGDLVYLATDGIRSYAATERNEDVELGIISQAIQPIIRPLLSQSFDEDKYASCVIRRKSQYRLFVNDTNTTEADAEGYLGYFTDTPLTPLGQYEWSLMRGIRPYCSDSEYGTDNDELSVIGHPTNGYVYQLESGNTFDGTIIEAIYRSPDLTFDDATLRKVFFKADIFTQVEGDTDFDMQLILDRDVSGAIQPSPININRSGSIAVYGSATYGTSIYGEFESPLFKRNLIGSGFFGAFQFTSTTGDAPFRIDSFQIQFSVKGRR